MLSRRFFVVLALLLAACGGKVNPPPPVSRLDVDANPLCLGRSSSTTVEVRIARTTAFTGAVTVRADPVAGLTMDPVTIPPSSDRARITIRTTADAPPGPATLKLRAGDVVATVVVEIGAAEGGTRDKSFGVDGTVTVPLSFEGSFVVLAFQAESLLVSVTHDAGSASKSRLMRVRSNGTLDEGFGDPITHSIEDRPAFALGVRSDGRFLVGDASGHPTYREYSANGTPNGVQGISAQSFWTYPLAMHEMPDGSMLVSGFVYAGGASAYVQRNRPDGSLDPTFSSPIEFGNPTPGGSFRADGASVMATFNGLISYKSNGALAFHTDTGTTYTAAEWTPDGNIVAAGKELVMFDDSGEKLSTIEGVKLSSSALWVAVRRDRSIVALTETELMTVTPEGSVKGRALTKAQLPERRRLVLDACGRAVTAESTIEPEQSLLLRRYWP